MIYFNYNFSVLESVYIRNEEGGGVGGLIAKAALTSKMTSRDSTSSSGEEHFSSKLPE